MGEDVMAAKESLFSGKAIRSYWWHGAQPTTADPKALEYGKCPFHWSRRDDHLKPAAGATVGAADAKGVEATSASPGRATEAISAEAASAACASTGGNAKSVKVSKSVRQVASLSKL